MSDTLPDPRINAYRDDLASASLKDKVSVARYASGKTRQVVDGAAAMRGEPRHDAALDTELLFGEAVTVYDEQDGWAWAQSQVDSYVGYVSGDALSSHVVEPTHRVGALRTHLYPVADIKAPPLDLLSMNALVAVESVDGRFARLKDGRYAIARHLVPMDERVEDFVVVAQRFLGTPYLWGGRTSIGLDCSALIQISLQAAGVGCPRDSDMQEMSLGEALPDPQDLGSYRQGDLVFWKGHAGIVLDDARLLHANAHFMATVIEPLDEAIARIAGAESPVTSVRRL